MPDSTCKGVPPVRFSTLSVKMGLISLLFVLASLVACREAAPPPTGAPPPTPTQVPTPDIAATSVAKAREIEFQVKATVTAIPTQTPLPTHTPQPTYTPVPTLTPAPTYTPWPTHTPFPTPMPEPIGGDWHKFQHSDGKHAMSKFSDEATSRGKPIRPILMELECRDGQVKWVLFNIFGWGVTEFTPFSAWYAVDGGNPVPFTLLTNESDLGLPEPPSDAVASTRILKSDTVTVGLENFSFVWDMSAAQTIADDWLLPCKG